MKNRMILLSLMILVLITCSTNVFADDNVDNISLTTSESEIDVISQDFSDVVSTSEIVITDDNYDNYFNKFTGKLKDGVDTNINTIKISNVSNKAFTIDRPLNIMPVSNDCEISNGVIHLIAGSSGSNITGLTINNTKGELYQDGLFVCKLHGIWLSNSSDNTIMNNTIRIPGAEGCYAMPMGYSSRNKILYNDIISTFTSCILMGLCDYNNISYNRIEILTIKSMVAADIIYCNPFGHADYSGPATCIGTYISNNYLKNSNINDIWEYTVNILGESNNTQIINNTVINGYLGIVVTDPWNDAQANNVTISGNTIINATFSVDATTNDVTVSNNKIIGSSMKVGISIGSGKYPNENCSVFENEIEYNDLSAGIVVNGEANVFKNNIKLYRYGYGISVPGDGTKVHDNYVDVVSDSGVAINANNVSVYDNVIHTKSNGVSATVSLASHKIVNNTISNNKIYSDGYAVYVEGYVYNTTINNNYVETNSTNAFNIDVYATLENNNPGIIAENTVNGVIENTEIIIINDTNFYDYFDEEGYLKYNFKANSQRILFITFLSNKNLYFTDSITLTSNKQANLLFNVTITLKEDASDSTIKDFKFYSFDKESIILDGVENVVINGNEFTSLTSNIFEIKTISASGGCRLCNITDNSIFMNSNANYTYAILVSEPQHVIKKKFSQNLTISNNNILIKSSGVAEAMYFDALVSSDIADNNINIKSEGSAYGIAICNVMGRPYDVNIKSNKIIVSSKEMSYLIELFRVDKCLILNNYLKATSNGVYGIGVYDSGSTINGNEMIVVGRNLTSNSPADALGKGNSVFYITRQSQIDEFKNNIIDSQNCEIITNIDSNIENIDSNSFVISNYNYNLYFKNQKLSGGIIKDGDVILFKNFTDSKTMDVNVNVDIRPYNHFNNFSAVLILSEGSNKSKVTGFDFVDAKIMLNNVSDISVTLNNFTNSFLEDNNGHNNDILNNTFILNKDNNEVIILNNCFNDIFAFNKVFANSSNIKVIVIFKSNSTELLNNSFNITGDYISVITSELSNNIVLGDFIDISATGDIQAYLAKDNVNDVIKDNVISVTAIDGNPIAIYYNNSSNNIIKLNRIISNSKLGRDYAIVIVGEDNIVTNNYLISSNGFKRGDDAVNATGNFVHDNLPVIIYVSTNATEEGNGSFENPYPTIKKAIENCLSGSVIHVLPGVYNESGIIIDKNITLTAINLEGNTYINALNSQLFDIKAGGILSINALKIFNGFSVKGGSLFQNHGILMINNSIIYNSSSYYDNSNPSFARKNKYDARLYSYDCSNEGLGGAILNYGELMINASTLYNNFAHKGGAIADFGKTTIKNSLLFNNSGVHGGAIYTDSKNEMIIENSQFIDNLAVQTLDYCYIHRQYVNSNMESIRYHYLPMCESLPGLGGAIFSNTPLTIDNSLFNHNLAKAGGAIAYSTNILTNQNYYHDYLDYIGKGEQIKYSPTSILNIKNSLFKDNEATNTSGGNLTMLGEIQYGGKLYTIHFEGGAILGALTEFSVYNSTFIHNTANSDGGALCVQSLNSSIEASTFSDNVAGGSGGALDVFGNFKVFNTEIVNNSAKKGGALQYSSYEIYDHIQNNMDMFNVTVSGNSALDSAGAFLIGTVNFAIKNSNIYDNFAPKGNTFSGEYQVYTNSNIDARGNWWGTIDGPDNSVWNQANIRFRTWAGQRIDWNAVLVRGDSGDSDGDGNSLIGRQSSTSSISTGSGAHTGSTLSIDTSVSGNDGTGFNFNGNWPKGNNNGKEYIEGSNQFKHSGDSKTNVNGNKFNPSSLSRTNSSNVNDLASVGIISNAADVSTGAQSSSSDGVSGDSSNAYEIEKEVKDLSEIDVYSPFYIILFLIMGLLFFIGFYRKYNSGD